VNGHCNIHREDAKTRRFLFQKPGDLSSRLRAFAVCFGFFCCLACAAQGPEMARVGLRCNDPAADLTVDGAPAGKASDYAKTKLTLRPGHHVFRVSRSDGTVQVREADLGPGDWIALDLGGTK
jgi:hypothetical protein